MWLMYPEVHQNACGKMTSIQLMGPIGRTTTHTKVKAIKALNGVHRLYSIVVKTEK